MKHWKRNLPPLEHTPAVVDELPRLPRRFRKRLARALPWSRMTEEQRAATVAAMNAPSPITDQL